MKKKNVLKKVLIGVAIILITLVTSIGIVWHHELSTIFSIKELREKDPSHNDGALYEIKVSGGFYLDDFVAQGGVSNDTELINFITDHITKGLIDLGIEAPNIGCSSFTASLENKEKLFGRNYDFDETNTAIVYTEGGKNRYKTISVVDLQFLGIDKDKGIDGVMDKVITLSAPYAPLDGINEAGVACGIYMTYQGGEKTVATDQNTAKPDITSTTLLRLILDYAGSVEEAVEIAKNYDLHDSANTSYHYMVADSTGKSAILEWVNLTDDKDNDGSKRELVVTYNDNDASLGTKEEKASYQWVTNFVVTPGYYEGLNKSEMKGLDRYDAIYNELSKTDGVLETIDDALDILKLVGRRNWNNDDNNGITVHSVVYNLSDKTAYFVSNENFDDPSAIFKLSFE